MKQGNGKTKRGCLPALGEMPAADNQCLRMRVFDSMDFFYLGRTREMERESGWGSIACKPYNTPAQQKLKCR